MKKWPPLQVIIFLFLLFFVLAGSVLDQTIAPLQNLVRSKHIANGTSENASLEKDAKRENPAIAAFTEKSRSSKNLSGTVMLTGNNEILIAHNDSPKVLQFTSNTYVWRNGIDTTTKQVRKDDVVWASTNDGRTIARMTALSQPAVYLLLLFTIIISVFTPILAVRYLLRHTFSSPWTAFSHG
ncbi:MAG: hypothetical protein Q8Q49_04485 [bacterium]|nr:hypothetical protein [bacterium]